MRAAGCAVAALCALGCAKPPQGPVCGLHSAANVVWVVGKDSRRPLAVGGRVSPADVLEASGYALVECFGGGLKALEKGDTVKVGDLKEARLQGFSLPVHALKDGKAVPLEAPPRTVAARYVDNQFTPASALHDDTLTEADYFKAFFTPNGFDKLGGGPAPDGPRKLAAPPNRARVPNIHAGDLGEGPLLATVDDEAVFVETDDLATAALLEGRTYALGRAVRVLVPDGAEVTLELKDRQELNLDGPLELRLQQGQSW